MADLDKINQALGLTFPQYSTPKRYIIRQFTRLALRYGCNQDVREYYAARCYLYNYSEMWDKFYSDRRWNDVNTLGAGSALIESTLAGDDKDRLARQ